MIAARLAEVDARIAAACARAERPREEVRLVAVGKTFPPERIAEAYAAGQRDFGESYAQELRDKARALDLPELRWHFVGPVQTNKVRYLVGTAGLVHALDRVDAARALADRARRQDLAPPPCLVSVNVAGEASKHGVAVDGAAALLEAALELGIPVRGLFTLPPYEDDPQAARPFFARLRELRDTLAGKIAPPDLFTELSMGMSHDLEVAVEEGATLVRVGTALFGERSR